MTDARRSAAIHAQSKTKIDLSVQELEKAGPDQGEAVTKGLGTEKTLRAPPHKNPTTTKS